VVTSAPVELGLSAFTVDAAGTRCVELERAPAVRAASLLKPLLAWVAASAESFAGDEAAWERLARRAVTISDNPATAALWSQGGEDRLVELLNERVGVAWRIAAGVEHPSLRVSVTAAEVARAYSALVGDDSHAARQVGRWMRETPGGQTFGLRPVVRDTVLVDDTAVGVKCGWFGGERAHAVVLAYMRDAVLGAVVTTAQSPDGTALAVIREASGDDMRLAAAHDDLVGGEIRSAIRRALVATNL
jgi:hypothetical protein